MPQVNFTNNDIEYWGGLALYLPFVKGADLTLGYRLSYKKKRIINENVSFINYQLETAELNHMFTLGIEFLFHEKERGGKNVNIATNEKNNSAVQLINRKIKHRSI